MTYMWLRAPSRSQGLGSSEESSNAAGRMICERDHTRLIELYISSRTGVSVVSKAYIRCVPLCSDMVQVIVL